jgi:SAM-dependent methyltransferase
MLSPTAAVLAHTNPVPDQSFASSSDWPVSLGSALDGTAGLGVLRIGGGSALHRLDDSQGNLAGTIAGGAITAIAAWASPALSRRHPRPMPYFFWCGLLWPRGFLAPEPLKKLLEPRAGERILELGPGIGVHAIPVAAVLAPDGRLDVLDIQPQMLDRLARRAAKAGEINIVAIGDVQHLPYPAASFDGAYLIDALGEMPNPPAVLRELRRVLKPAGRLVVGEHFVDPDFTPLGPLKDQAREAGFRFERRTGPIVVYLARFGVSRPQPQGIDGRAVNPSGQSGGRRARFAETLGGLTRTGALRGSDSCRRAPRTRRSRYPSHCSSECRSTALCRRAPKTARYLSVWRANRSADQFRTAAASPPDLRGGRS